VTVTSPPRETFVVKRIADAAVKKTAKISRRASSKGCRSTSLAEAARGVYLSRVVS
jgi:hypothetical protein